MFCKYCGSPITSKDDLICPKCAKKAKTEGGNEFLRPAEPVIHQELKPTPRILPVPPVEGKKQSHGGAIRSENVTFPVEGKKPSMLPIYICAFVCLLCVVFLISGRIENKRTLRDAEATYQLKLDRLETNSQNDLNEKTEDFNNQLKQQEAEYEKQLKLLEDQLERQKEYYEGEIKDRDDRIDSLEQEVSSLRDAQETQKKTGVKKTPKDEKKEVGFFNKKGYLFCMEMYEPVVAFRWEKETENGEWIRLSFNENKENTEYGLKLDEDTQRGISKLIAVGLTRSSDGMYRCTAETVGGDYIAEVRLEIIISEE